MFRTNRKECIICSDSRYINRFPKSPHPGAEQHGSNSCFKCWEDHIHSQLANKQWDQISCTECSAVLSEPQIKQLDKFFANKVYDQWLDKAAKAAMESDEEYRECPSATCTYGCFLSTQDDRNIFRCQVCQALYCIFCEVPMHEGMTCEQYQRSKKSTAKRKRGMEKEEKLSAKKVKMISKACPKCTTNLDKYTGCDHVTCARCRHEFCWICFADYNGRQGIHQAGNIAHDVDCKYHPDRLPDYESPQDDDEDDYEQQQGQEWDTNEEPQGQEWYDNEEPQGQEWYDNEEAQGQEWDDNEEDEWHVYVVPRGRW